MNLSLNWSLTLATKILTTKKISV